jgi:type IV pilus assembly protein PilM
MGLIWQAVPGAPKTEDKYQEVLITAAAKTMIQKYTSIFALAGLELLSLETEAFALIRSLVGRDKTTTMIVDIGAYRTNIVIVENGIPYVNRSLAVGGLSVTKEVAAALGLSEDQAETMKLDAAALGALYQNPGQGGDFPKVFEKVFAPVVTELTYSANLFLGQKANESKRIEKIILTGGGALLPNLPEHLAKALSLRVYVGDPWARVVYPDPLRPTLAQVGPRFAAAVGLAMRDID